MIERRVTFYRKSYIKQGNLTMGVPFRDTNKHVC